MTHPKDWDYGELFAYCQHMGFIDENVEMNDCEYFREELYELVIEDLIHTIKKEE